MKIIKFLTISIIFLAIASGCSKSDTNTAIITPGSIQPSDEVKTKVLDLVSQMPAQGTEQTDQLAKQLIELNPEATIILAKQLKPATEVNDNNALFGLSAMTKYVGRDNTSRQSSKHESALLYALAITPENTNKAFLISQLQFIASDKSVQPLKALLSDPYLNDYAARTLTTIGTKNATNALLETLNSPGSSDNIYIIQALGQLQCQPAASKIAEYAKDDNSKLSITSIQALANIGNPLSKSVLARIAKTGDNYTKAKHISLYLAYAKRLAENGYPEMCEQICKDLIGQTDIAANLQYAAHQTLMDATGKQLVCPPDGFTSLFNGINLNGWEMHAGLPGDNNQPKGKWFVEDGAIVGIQDPPGGGGFLTTTETFRDFELTMETKIDWPFDSGVFLRVGPDGKSHQVTLDYRESGEIGGIYCPWTRGFVHHCPEGIKQFQKDKWNKLRIVCTGEPANIKVWVNNTLITDFQHTAETTADIPAEGTICLQVHPGGEGYDTSKARFKNIFIRKLNNDEPLNTLTETEKSQGFIQLFNGKDLTGWVGSTDSYGVKDGVMFCRKNTGRNVYTKDEYDNFHLKFEFKLEPGSNNGLGIRAPLEGDAAYVGMELQILDNTAEKYSNLHDWQYHGSIYGISPAKRGYLKPVGQWNKEEVIANGNDIKVILNGTVIVDANLKEATKDGIISNTEHPGLFNKTGHIGFLGHGDYVEFRNIRIKPIK